MSDRLIEIIEAAKDEYIKGIGKPRKYLTDYIADHLIAAGIIVPPCKVGDTVYMPWQWRGKDGIAILTVERISITGARTAVRTDFYSDSCAYFHKYKCGVFGFDDFGKHIFLTKEEAEKALAERR